MKSDSEDLLYCFDLALPSHLTSDDTALKEGGGERAAFLLTFTSYALNVQPIWEKKGSDSAALSGR